MSTRKSALLVLALILVSSLAAYALAAGVVVRTMTTSPALPNPNHKPGAPVAPIQVDTGTVVTPVRPPGGPTGLNLPPLHPVLVVTRRADSYTSILHGAFVKHTGFGSVAVSTYLQLPTGTQTLTHKVVISDAKITDDHTYTATTVNGKTTMESITFSYIKLTDTTPKTATPIPSGGGNGVGIGDGVVKPGQQQPMEQQ